MEQIKKAVIEISSVVSNDEKALKIKDSNNLAYTVWKVKQDLTETKAWSVLKNMPGFGLGQKFTISFKEENKTYMNKPYIARTIILVDQASGAVSVSSVPAQQSFPSPQKTQKNDDNAEGKVRHGFALEAFKLGLELDKALADNIERWVKYVLNGKLPDPVMEQIIETMGGEEIDSEDIPF